MVKCCHPTRLPLFWGSLPSYGRFHHALLSHWEEPRPHTLGGGPHATTGTWCGMLGSCSSCKVALWHCGLSNQHVFFGLSLTCWTTLFIVHKQETPIMQLFHCGQGQLTGSIPSPLSQMAWSKGNQRSFVATAPHPTRAFSSYQHCPNVTINVNVTFPLPDACNGHNGRPYSLLPRNRKTPNK